MTVPVEPWYPRVQDASYTIRFLEAKVVAKGKKAVDAAPASDGYVHLERHWQAGDSHQAHFLMEPT